MESFWNSSNLLKIFIKWKWHIISITFLGMAIIGASTYLIKPLYKSYAIVYPVNLGTFSEESFSEQMMQIFESRDIADKIIESYNLLDHYEIDTASEHIKSTLYKELGDKVWMEKTEYESIEINVLDTDPEIAKEITNSFLDFYNEKVRDIHRFKTKEVMDLAMSEMLKWEEIKDSLNIKLQFYKTEYNIQDIGIQLGNLTQGMYRASGNSKLIDKAENQINLIAKYGAEFSFLNNMYWKAFGLYNSNRLAYEDALKEYNKKISYANIVTSPYASDKKYSPKRIPITMLGGLSVFALLILIIAFVENKKHNV